MATTPVDVNTKTWTDCGATPCFIQNLGPSAFIRFVIDTVAPTDPQKAGHILGAGEGLDSSADIGIEGQKVFAIGLGRNNTLMVSR